MGRKLWTNMPPLRRMRGVLTQYLTHDEQQEELQLMHQLFAATAVFTLLAAGGALWVQFPHFDALDRIMLPVIGLSYLLMLPAVLSGRLETRRAFILSFLLHAIYLLLAYSHQFLAFAPQHGVLSQNTYWFAALYVSAFLTFPMRLAQYFTRGLLLLTLGITGLHLLLNPALLHERELLGSILQFLLSGLVIMALQARFGHLRDRLNTLRAAAYHDVLTGAANRRAAEEHLAALHHAQGAYSVILFDLDHFKHVNDQYGHATGDQVLSGVTRTARHLLPARALLARWGGEEFLIVLPTVPDCKVQEFVEALRDRLQHQCFGPLTGVTACFGIAHAHPAETPEQVVSRADQAMYAVKNRGRNGLEFARPRPHSPGDLLPTAL